MQFIALVLSFSLALTAEGTPNMTSAKFNNLLLRTQGVALIRPNEAGVFKPFGAIPCCIRANYLWPLVNESWIDFTNANMFHMRMGPFNGASEPQFAILGGPYLNDTPPDFNLAFWERVKQVLDHAGNVGANVEINVVDTWWCKHARTGGPMDQTMPWDQSDIDACAIFSTPIQEAWIRKVVQETGAYANVIYITDNEGDLVPGFQQAWFDWVHAVIRDEEQKLPTPVVHLIGTNNPDLNNFNAFDYIAVHATGGPFLAPIDNKHTENNERGSMPFISVQDELARFLDARSKGLNYWYWRGQMSDADMIELLSLMAESSMGSTNTIFRLERGSATPPVTLGAEFIDILDASTPQGVIEAMAFDPTIAQFMDWFETVPSHYDGGGFTISWKGGTDNTSTGTLELEVGMIVIADATILTGDLGLDAATPVSITDTPPATPINKLNYSTTGILSHANAGSPSPGDRVGIRAKRDTATDTNTGKLQLAEILILET